MNKKLAGIGIVTASALVVASLSGCINVTIQNKSNENENKTENVEKNTNTEEKNTNTPANNETNANKPSNTESNANSNANEGQGDSNPLADKQVGSKKVGYVTVPSDWKDRTSDVDERIRDSNATVLVVDPTTEFTSGVLSHFAFSASVQLETFPTSYENRADEILYDLRAKTDDYANVEIKKDKFNGHDASVITCESADGIDVKYIIFDKDGSGNACIVAMAYSTPSTAPTVNKVLASWSEA